MRMILRRLKKLHRDQSGFAMVSVLILLLVGTLFALAAWSSSKADITPSMRDRQQKEAYAAAESGINYYLFRLNQNNAYWTDCDQLPPITTNPLVQSPVSLAGAATLRWRTVPGTSTQYAIELMPQNGINPSTSAWCTPGATAASSLLDSSSGTLQIRSTGKSGSVRRSVIATLRRTGFLDYLYFTDFETQDPQVTGSGATCDVYRRAGRSSSCSNIVFASDDAINGPFHTNDDILVCGTPDFGRTLADKVEVVTPATQSFPGWADGCGGGANPNFKGTWQAGADKIDLPASNSTLQATAQAGGYLYTGTTQITLHKDTIDVTNGGTTSSGIAYPGNGVIYVKTGSGCTASWSSPQTYTEQASCGNVYVKGTGYGRSLTIGTDRDVIVNGNITRDSTRNVLLGLIANYFVRVYHPVSSCGDTASGPFGPSLGSVQIDAAILSLQHSFIVDNYSCGSPRGTLTVNGAIGQKFRGPVGTGGSSINTGYVKNYNYDDRFRVANPPYFLDPVQSAWRKIRYNEELPARQGG
jgi:Tfp pilus assembly protein PilX